VALQARWGPRDRGRVRNRGLGVQPWRVVRHRRIRQRRGHWPMAWDLRAV